MKFVDLKTKLKDFIVFTQQDIKTLDPEFSRQNLSEWQKKGYIKKIIKGFYVFAELEINDQILFTISNKLFEPSYISLEMALSYYHLIPEAVYGITAASSRNTYKFKTLLGSFIYKKIKPELMFGYKLVRYKNYTFKMAEIEKAVLDYFYIKPHLKTEDDFYELRINKDSLFEQIKIKKLNSYLKLFNNKSLSDRVGKFVRFMKG